MARIFDTSECPIPHEYMTLLPTFKKQTLTSPKHESKNRNHLKIQ